MSGESTSRASQPIQGKSFHSTCCLVGVDNDFWIIDSGATDHICTSLKWFDKYVKIHPISVIIPNGNVIVAKYAGIMNCSFIFTDGSCCIQDLSRRMIGLANMMNGLYYLNSQHFFSSHALRNKTCNSIVIPNSALWLFILGYLFNSSLDKMFVQFPYLHINKISVCDAYYYAKQKKLPYSLSFSHVKHSF
uniref:Retrovirus-related Pol polyprotein from transposon TNT 1-94-like beta-barrel domain-containing protein n=1 Tax=Cajanus cajan TaxID=3821 RepID=A0A151RN62_CAJCA|nr:hypothetical protein KK1_034595 [Cajanus cajan]